MSDDSHNATMRTTSDAVPEAKPGATGGDQADGAVEGTPRYHLYQAQTPLNGAEDSLRRYGKARSMSGQSADMKHYRKFKQSSAGCIQFLTKGTCGYGNKCRFSHSKNAPIFPSPAYRKYGGGYAKPSSVVMAVPMQMCASPSRYSELVSLMNAPFNQELLFPALPTYREYHGAGADMDLPGTRATPRPASPLSPSKKLLFKDAVLKRNAARDGTGSLAAGYHDQHQESLNANALLGEDVKQNPHRHKLAHRRDWTSHGRRHSDPAERRECQLHRTDNVQHGSECRCLPPRSPNYTQPRVQPSRTSCPATGLEDALYSNLSIHAEALLSCLDAGLAAIEPIQLEAVTALRVAVASRWADAIIDVYGSNYTRLALPVSDIDCVLLSKSLSGESPFKILKELEELVQVQPWAKRVDFLGSAKIPVLKITFLSVASNVEVLLDLTCGHSPGHSGLSARDLIYSCQAEMPALRPLVMVLKCHLHSHDLNCAFTGGLSSYALVILVIRFLQACGDEHFKSFDGSMARKIDRLRYRSWSDGSPPYDSGVNAVSAPSIASAGLKATWCYTFSRGNCITWRTGIGNLLLLFLETYIAFDYRRYGISINKGGEYFSLPADKVVSEPCSAVTPYIVDPIKRGRNIGNCFRMSEVVQAWYALYQNLMSGASLEACVAQRLDFETS